MYRVQFFAYCGMSGVPRTFESLRDARDYAAARLARAHARGCRPYTLVPGKRWEIPEPDDVMMVPDDCGELVIRHDTFECRECGCAHETRDAATTCCAEQE